MTPSNVYRPSRLKLLLASGAALAAGAAFFLFSGIAIEHVYGALFLALGAAGFAWHFARPPLELRIEPDALVVAGLRVAWGEVDVSQLKERGRGSQRFSAFEVMVKDAARETGRRTLVIEQPSWPRFDELYDALRGMVSERATSQSTASR